MTDDGSTQSLKTNISLSLLFLIAIRVTWDCISRYLPTHKSGKVYWTKSNIVLCSSWRLRCIKCHAIFSSQMQDICTCYVGMLIRSRGAKFLYQIPCSENCTQVGEVIE